VGPPWAIGVSLEGLTTEGALQVLKGAWQWQVELASPSWPMASEQRDGLENGWACKAVFEEVQGIFKGRCTTGVFNGLSTLKGLVKELCERAHAASERMIGAKLEKEVRSRQREENLG